MFVEKSLVTDGQAPQQSNERKRSLGAFYTPPDLSRILCEWAIRSVDDVVLEPSFGGCNFLEEIASRFDLLGADNPLSSVFGCDIDVHAFDKLRLLRCGFNSCNFLLKDFLLIESSEFCLGGGGCGNWESSLYWSCSDRGRAEKSFIWLARKKDDACRCKV